MIIKSKKGIKANTCSFFEKAETNPKQGSGKTNMFDTTVISLFKLKKQENSRNKKKIKFKS